MHTNSTRRKQPRATCYGAPPYNPVSESCDISQSNDAEQHSAAPEQMTPRMLPPHAVSAHVPAAPDSLHLPVPEPRGALRPRAHRFSEWSALYIEACYTLLDSFCVRNLMKGIRRAQNETIEPPGARLIPSQPLPSTSQ